jgi:Trk K+ transport system NAD-binding subunit
VVIAWLGVAALALVAAAALVVAVFHQGIDNGKAVGVGEAFWQNLLRLLDTGTMAGDNGWLLRLVSLFVTVTGIFVATSLIGLVATGIDQRISNLRRGRSAVVEQGHTLVLGWSPRVFAVLAELVEANANQRRRVVVILSGQDKMVMEERLRTVLPSFGTTRVVCRTGDPSSAHDLGLVNLSGARSIIVLAGEGSGDAAAIKAVLAVMTGDTGDRAVPLVVEMLDQHSARALSAAVGERVLTVQPDDVIAKVTAQACHQPGMGVVYRELLDFAGEEIYFAPAPELVGHTFAEAVLAYDRAAIMGRVGPDGAVELNPPADTVFGPGDAVIAVAADDDSVVFNGFREAMPSPTRVATKGPRSSQRMLIVGWSSLGARILQELDQLLVGRTPVDVLVDDALVGLRSLDIPECPSLDVIFHRSQDEAAQLSELVSGTVYEHVIVLAYRDGLSLAEVDAHTMLTLLTLRRGREGVASWPRVVAEVVDSRMVALAETAGADDLVVSDRLASLMIAQLAENPSVRAVLDDLFSPHGVTIELQPAHAYVDGGPQEFAVAVSAALSRQESAIGYRLANGEVVLNPSKTTRLSLGSDDWVCSSDLAPPVSVVLI